MIDNDVFDDELCGSIKKSSILRILKKNHAIYDDSLGRRIDTGNDTVIVETEKHQFSDAYTPEEAEKVYQRLLAKWKGRSMFNEIKEGFTQFVKENRTIITWVAILFLVDHFFLGGKFRSRIHGMIESLLSKTEEKVKALK